MSSHSSSSPRGTERALMPKVTGASYGPGGRRRYLHTRIRQRAVEHQRVNHHGHCHTAGLPVRIIGLSREFQRSALPVRSRGGAKSRVDRTPGLRPFRARRRERQSANPALLNDAIAMTVRRRRRRSNRSPETASAQSHSRQQTGRTRAGRRRALPSALSPWYSRSDIGYTRATAACTALPVEVRMRLSRDWASISA